MKSRRRLLPFAVICALVLALAFAAGASAQILKGEETLPESPALEGEEDLLAASATFDSTTGALTVTDTTRSAPTANEHLALIGGLLSVNAPCTVQALGEASTKDPNAGWPAFKIQSFFSAENLPAGFPQTAWFYSVSKKEEEEQEAAKKFGTGTRVVEGTKTTIAATAPKAIGSSTFTCAIVAVSNTGGGGGSEPDFAVFPLVAQSEPVAPVVVPPAVIAPPAPKAALSLLKSKPLKLKTEKWTTVKFKITNTGNAEVGPITIKAKAPKGVTLQTKSVELPALLAGQTWPVSFRVKVTEAAKAKSLLKLTATATGLSASSTVTIKQAH
jgi:hypothetical protein